MITVILLIAYCLFSNCSSAQTISARKITMQVEAGTTIGMFSFRGMEDYSGLTYICPKLGLDLGLAVNIKLNEELRLQTGISLVQHGAVITFSDPNPNCMNTIYQRDEMMFSYLQIPVLLKAGKERGMYGCFGLALSVPVKVTDEYERQDRKWTVTSSKEIIKYNGISSDAVKEQVPLRLAAILKVGYNFKNSMGMFVGFDIATGTPNTSTKINNSFYQSMGPRFSFSDSGLSLGATYKF